MTAVAERVARGAALLDGKLPGWAERIDLAELELSSCYRCVLGQLFASAAAARGTGWHGYDIGLQALDVDDDGPYGFDRTDIDQTWAELTAEWRRTIAARRLACLTPC